MVKVTKQRMQVPIGSSTPIPVSYEEDLPEHEYRHGPNPNLDLCECGEPLMSPVHPRPRLELTVADGADTQELKQALEDAFDETAGTQDTPASKPRNHRKR